MSVPKTDNDGGSYMRSVNCFVSRSARTGSGTSLRSQVMMCMCIAR